MKSIKLPFLIIVFIFSNIVARPTFADAQSANVELKVRNLLSGIYGQVEEMNRSAGKRPDCGDQLKGEEAFTLECFKQFQTQLDRSSSNKARTPLEWERVLKMFRPGTFKIAFSSLTREIDDLMDLIVLDILRSSAKLNMCSTFFSGQNPLTAWQVLGISGGAFREALRICGQNLDDSQFIPPRAIGFSRIVLVFSDDELIPFKGWTSADGHSFIVVPRVKINYQDLRKTFAHELFQRIDFKSQFGVDRSLKAAYRGENYCVAAAAVANPIVRMGLSSMRSSVFEDQVAGTSPSARSNASCEIKAKYFVKAVQNLWPLVVPEATAPHQTISECTIRFHDLSLDEALLVLSREKIQFPGQAEMSLCEYLAYPEFTPPNRSLRDQLYKQPRISKGPRPNIGSGGGGHSLSSLEDDDQKLIFEYPVSFKPQIRQGGEYFRAYEAKKLKLRYFDLK